MSKSEIEFANEQINRMSDLISREALSRGIESINPKYGNENSSLIEQGEVLDLIAEAPTVDAVEVVHGHWNCNVLFYGTHTCSNCGKDPIHYDGRTGYVEILSDYCPNCGAKMDEVGE